MTAVIWSSTEKLMVIWINSRFTEHSQESLIKQRVLFSFLPDLMFDPCFTKLFLSHRAALSVSQMNKMNMKATDSRIQILKELGIVELDEQGNIKLAVQMKADL